MARPARGRAAGPGYSLRFAGTAAVTVGLALVLVLVVLPRRYVLSSGFQESGVSFPTAARTPVVPTGTRRAAPAPVAPPEPAPAPVLAVDVPRGPAERFWDALLPLLAGEDREAALALFREYLDRYPEDRDVRREYAVTLLRAGRPDEAAEQIRRLLDGADDPELRLLLARTLRDQGRMDAASAQYALLVSRGTDGRDVRLEWARSLAWVELYEDALGVLDEGLRIHGDDLALRVERARVLYYSGRPAQADDALDGIPADALARFDALELRESVRATLAEAEAETPEPPTELERALRARAEGRTREAAGILRAILARDPEARDAWLAYANLLQYDLEQPDEALEALIRVRDLDRATGAAADPALEYRMAQLEVWTGRTDAARDRLLGLLARVRDGGPVPVSGDAGSGEEISEADVLALLGDLDRWEGDRPAAAARYRAALALEPDQPDARDGLQALETQLAMHLDGTERPRLGGLADAILDSDDFRRLDLAGDWAGAHREWVWGVRPGHRWLEGLNQTGGSDALRGYFAELEGGRWWRWGTVRTALSLGIEELGLDDPLLRVGAEVRIVDPDGWTLTGELSRGPAYSTTTTLQSVFLDVVQDALRVSLSRPLTPIWSLWSEGQLARLTWDGDGDGAFRYLGAVALNARITGTLSAGAELRALGHADAAPPAGPLPAYWDPRLAVSLTPTVAWRDSVAPGLTLSAGAAAGGAFVRERRISGDGEFLPVGSLLAGLEWRTDHFRLDADAFFRQSRFEGYRNWGGNLSVSVPLSVGGYR